MKVLSLHVENIRGIKKIDLEPKGENFVVYGPNGTGKSAIVDALDFLFTGRISRLIGEGTSRITLSRHGCHIDTNPEEAFVKAKIEIPGSKDIFELKRTISERGNLQILRGDESKLSDVLRIATRGHHVLSRRAILKYVAAQKGERAKEIQALLNLENVERLRQFFVSIENDTSRNYDSSKTQYDSARNELCHYLSIVTDQFSEKKAIEKINELRKKLKGSPISVLEEERIKRDLSPPVIPLKVKIVDPNFIKSNINEILRIFDKELTKVRESEEQLISDLKKLKTDEVLKKELQSIRLLELGVNLLDESGKCPLCEKEWEPTELRKKLEERLLSAKQAKKLQMHIDEFLEFIRSKYNNLKNCLEGIEKYLDIFDLKELTLTFQKWINDVKSLFDTLADAENKIDKIEQILQKHDMFAPEKFEEMFKAIELKVDTEGKKLTEEQKAWDTLTRLEPIVRIYIKNQKSFNKSEVAFKRARLIRNNYEDSKDKVLNDLYNRIKNDFVAYYKFIHGADEDKFDADFIAKGSELIFEVDFYGRGKFPPLALHSEGHQDSMGVCLYLALMKLLSEGKVLLTILDDVVMSIDSNHRRAFSQLLLKCFPDRQFLITTHNRTWARQLQTDGIVQGKNMRDFQRWSVDTGPIYEEDIEIWKRIDILIANNNISSAAAALREGSEFYFQEVCEKLQGKVILKGDGRYELGDLLPTVIGQYRKLLNIAKKAANSWNKKEDINKLTEIESVAGEIIKRSRVEQWGINENVHYSKWSDFAKGDFQPIAEAFKDLFDLFRCSKCGGILYVTSSNKELRNLRCNCENVNWNLIRKKRSDTL